MSSRQRSINSPTQQQSPPQGSTFCNSFDQQQRQSSYSTMIPRDTTTSAAQHRSSSSSHSNTMNNSADPTHGRSLESSSCTRYSQDNDRSRLLRFNGSFRDAAHHPTVLDPYYKDTSSGNRFNKLRPSGATLGHNHQSTTSNAHHGQDYPRNDFQQVNRGQEDQRDSYNNNSYPVTDHSPSMYTQEQEGRFSANDESRNSMRRRHHHHHSAISEDEGKSNDNTREQQQQDESLFDIKVKVLLFFFVVTMIGSLAYYVWTVVIPYLFQVVFPIVYNLLCIASACSIVACIWWLLYSRTVTASATTTGAAKSGGNVRTSAASPPVVSPPPTKTIKSERRATKSSKRKDRESARENARRKMDALYEVQQRKSEAFRGEQRPIPPDVSGLTRPEKQRAYQEYWSDNKNKKYLGD